ncbi:MULTISPECIES: DUF6882 domain-containing protein [Flavobacterium]|uniref:DUF6882 domain-containing protein n=1 Tax=Flavobacterium jumunjinense TaxID=998845 RepID=A0ABV5GJW0_9FLAO|nr:MULTISPECIES: DUF6882 domain-containing protein [Flavobacterium]
MSFQNKTKSDFNTFLELLDQNAALSLEKQFLFGDIIESKPWQLDMSLGTISFEELTFPIQIIGSLSFNNNSWMWGWANTQSGIPENLLIQSNQLKNIGTDKNIVELTDAHFQVAEGFEHKIGMIACGLFNSKSYYCANYGQGTLVVTIDSDLIPEIDTNKAEKILTHFPQVISSIDVNHKDAFINYLIDKEFQIAITPNTVQAMKNESTITADFDALGRLTSLNGTIK